MIRMLSDVISSKQMRFIGSKGLLVDKIKEVIEENIHDRSKSLCDIFSGTSSVSRYFKNDYRIISNDIMYFSYVLQLATIQNNKMPQFKGLKKIGIDDPLNYLENIDISNINFQDNKFFMSNNYAPTEECSRMYLTKENANRIDFIRVQIDEWKNEKLIEPNEYYYILACLIESVPFVSNISGTYGAYLKHWDKRALNKIELQRLDIIDNKKRNVCHNKDANKLIKEIKGDILYLDPPYNSRQYVPNYHLLETLALNDYPEIKGVTGLRNYDDKKSKYCIKKDVKDAFEHLIKEAEFKHIIISYSTDGLMSIEEIEEILKKYCNADTYKLYKIPYRKYKSKHEQEDNKLYELIFYIRKSDSIQRIYDRNINIEYKVYKYKSKSRKEKYIKSPLNYIGGKHKLLDQIIPHFPNEIDTFIDLFTGGLNVGINIKANKIIANDYNYFIIDIFKEFRNRDKKEVIDHIEGRINEFNLSKSNEEGFKKFREFYNSNQNPLDLYTLVCYSFNYQFRFNNDLEYNNPFGRERSQFSQALKEKLSLFIDELQRKEIEISCEDYTKFKNFKFKSNDFVYCDPPYLITTGSYNDGNRGFKTWGESEEIELLKFLDHLNNNNIKFALSNVLEHKGQSNDILKEWSKNYKIIDLNYDYANSSYNTSNNKGNSREVLIINY